LTGTAGTGKYDGTMRISFRALLMVLALVLGVTQPYSDGTDACCTEEDDSSAPACPPNASCACCPVRAPLEPVEVEVPPRAAAGRAVPVVVPEPVVQGAATDIFHPPRG
jgi:hypothetical protein